MVIKAGITAILAALLAGGVVYYGMPANTTAAQVNVSKVDEVEASANKPDAKRWIDKYLRPEAKPQKSQVASAVKRNPKPSVDATDSDNSADKQIETRQVVNDNANATPEIRNRAVNMPAERADDREVAQTPKSDVIARIRTAMKQAESISRPELKDRAYMSVVDYAVANDAFEQGQNALRKIQQTELRDTARSRVAIAFAKAGQSRAAFDMVEAVEVEELRDVIRLQTIEALIVPERLPPGMP